MPVDYEDLGYPDEWPATTEIGKSEAPTNCPDCSILRAEVERLTAERDALARRMRVVYLPGFGRHSIHADDDCESHAVDWRSRALAAEGRLRTVERMFQDVGSYRDFAAALDAWAAAHPEVTP